MVQLSRRRRWSAAAAAAATAVVVAGVAIAAVSASRHQHTTVTASASARSTASASASRSAAVSVSADAQCPQPAQRISADTLKAFHAITAVTCSTDSRDYPGDGEWLVDVRKVAVAGVPALQAAFELPSQPLGSAAGGCTLDLVIAPPVVFVDAAGNSLAPGAPTTSCGKPLPQVLNAVTAATWVEVSARKIRQTVTPQAQAAHCEMQWKNENRITDEMGGPQTDGGGGPVFMHPATTLHICIYRDSGIDPEVGDFERVRDVSGADAVALAKALEGPPPTGTCHSQPEFAVVGAGPGSWANVELGGCWRVARNYPRFGTGTADRAAVSRLLGD